MADLPAYKPCPHGGWSDHVTQMIDLLSPVLNPGMDPVDRIIHVDNLIDDMCPWHIIALLHMTLAFLGGFNITAEELSLSTKTLRERSEDTIPISHP